MRKWIICLLIILLSLLGYGALNVQARDAGQGENHETQNFKEIEVKKKNEGYEIIGKAKVQKGVFYYAVENGHQQLVSEQKIETDSLKWTPFNILLAISEQELPKNGVLILYLYEKQSSGEMFGSYPVVVDRFNFIQ